MNSPERIRKWLVSSGVLNRVGKPSRYIGKELNRVMKNPAEKLRILLAFPDTYEVGMSHLGLKILYKELNLVDEFYAERAYLPWKDMIGEMYNAEIPLFSMETYTPAIDFDILGITLQYELCYSNVLALLDLADIPLLQKERTTEPIVLGGGPCSTNPEPMANYFDAFVIGDGEAVTPILCNEVRENIDLLKFGRRSELLQLLSQVQGVYVPSIGKKETVKAVIGDLSAYEIDSNPLVPYMRTVHDRAVFEIMRGCNRGCRFCQAGMIYRPVRERGVEEISRSVRKVLKQTGYEEISFLSLSTMDHSSIDLLTEEILPLLQPQRVALSLPSTRIDSFGVEIASKIASIRKTGLTFAPEAGSQRLRNVINKNVSEDDLMSTVRAARKNGWQRVKLYFMIGLPTERDEDLEEIVRLARRVKAVGFREVSVSAAIFIPKAHTPFQFSPQIGEVEAARRLGILKRLSGRGIQLSSHDPSGSTIEGVLSRGSREVGKAILKAYRLGAIFDEWNEEFDAAIWHEAFRAAEIDVDDYMRGYDTHEELPWEHISTGISKSFLIEEYEKALREETTGDCRWEGCTGCAVCQTLNVSNVLRKV
jgi:radical SAM superfamily enzyme YgiQ (UPF0313 family)